ncbi:hypothetical protein GWI33_007479 [Rhynchophorus ferrugineus]|uniref:Uncharacterized protein n=1 Tax=Rhynchophorus ferrugineus TaxID=354439 RepID=A0A834MD21_RHYFE|nr:hypothetical protein GWI33_007479 [Rhynchophorus ferrugineus]
MPAERQEKKLTVACSRNSSARAHSDVRLSAGPPESASERAAPAAFYAVVDTRSVGAMTKINWPRCIKSPCEPVNFPK